MQMLETSFKTGSFKDWLGQEHKFVVAAVVVDHSEELMLATVGRISDDKVIVAPVQEFNEDGHIKRSVFIGHSICNPNDEYNEKLGMKIAANRAVCNKIPQRWIATDRPTMITPELIDVLLTQEVAYIAENPDKIVKGYNKAKDRYEQKQLALKKYAALPAPEQALVKAAMGGADLAEVESLAKDLQGEKLLPPPADTPASDVAPARYHRYG